MAASAQARAYETPGIQSTAFAQRAAAGRRLEQGGAIADNLKEMPDSGKAWHEHFTTDEIKDIRAVSNWRGLATILTNYVLVAAAMGMVILWPNVFTVVLALFVIGARQLGFAVVMHEAAHHTLFTNRKLNDFIGNWFAAYPIFMSANMYRAHHLEHHAKTWTDEDPDIDLATGFPVSKASMARKVLRDLLGITGLKQTLGVAYLCAKVIAGETVRIRSLPLKLERGATIRMFIGTVVTHALLFAFLWAIGQPLLYLLWLGAFLTAYRLVTRIRSIAEHALISDPSNPLQHARTVHANWFERLFIAPNLVQYHLEHHLLMTVPHYRLPRFHALLRERGLLEQANVAGGYTEVLRAAVA